MNIWLPFSLTILLFAHPALGADPSTDVAEAEHAEQDAHGELLRPDAPASDPRTKEWVQHILTQQGLAGEELDAITQQIIASMVEDEQFESDLTYLTGTVDVGDGLATLEMEQGWRWLDSDDASRVLTHWGNPVMKAPLGMIFPDDNMATAGWGVLVRFQEDGFVDDQDANTIDYDDLLAEMQQSTIDESEGRIATGYASVDLVGWAEDPHYDAQANMLYWAKELHFGGDDENTLNYDVRVLGRRGVLSLNAVAGIQELADVHVSMDDLMDRVEFNDGHRYQDFDPKIDRIAAYGIGALVAGKLTAKTGLLKVILGMLVAGKKFGVFILLGILAFGKRLLGMFTGTQPTEE